MIKPNDTVLCRLYNTPDKKYYGDYFTAKVIEITKTKKYNDDAPWYTHNEKATNYLVRRFDGSKIELHRNEIKRIIKKG